MITVDKINKTLDRYNLSVKRKATPDEIIEALMHALYIANVMSCETCVHDNNPECESCTNCRPWIDPEQNNWKYNETINITGQKSKNQRPASRGGV